jgi:hypothetical protein
MPLPLGTTHLFLSPPFNHEAELHTHFCRPLGYVALLCKNETYFRFLFLPVVLAGALRPLRYRSTPRLGPFFPCHTSAFFSHALKMLTNNEEDYWWVPP